MKAKELKPYIELLGYMMFKMCFARKIASVEATAEDVIDEWDEFIGLDFDEDIVDTTDFDDLEELENYYTSKVMEIKAIKN